MNTIPELLAFLRARSKDENMANILQTVEQFQLARQYVIDRVPDIHSCGPIPRRLNGGLSDWYPAPFRLIIAG
jgi:hypothetical protein